MMCSIIAALLLVCVISIDIALAEDKTPAYSKSQGMVFAGNRRPVKSTRFYKSSVNRMAKTMLSMTENGRKCNVTTKMTQACYTEGDSSTANITSIVDDANHKSYKDGSFKLLNRANRTLPQLNLNRRCDYQNAYDTRVDKPCPMDKSIHINFPCGISCRKDGIKTCELSECKDTYRCSSGTEVPVSNLCDGVEQCDNDEEYCGSPFSTYCTCIGLTINCKHRLKKLSASQTASSINLDLVRNPLRNISHIMDVSSPYLSYLVIQDCSMDQLSHIKWSSVEIFSEIQYLGITQNDFSVLSPGIFIGGDSLKSISDSERLSEVFSEVKFLHLSSNKISTIHEDAFHGLHNLISLDLSSNMIISLQKDIFSELFRLGSLYLSTNEIILLHEDIFKGLSGLYSLSLSSNRISSLPSSLFDNLQGLMSLNLSSNRISTLPERLFKGTPALVTLDLSENRLSNISEGIFQGLRSLWLLKLSSNKLSLIPENLFNGLHKLEELDLSLNIISSLPERVFKGLRGLRKLYLSSNMILSVSEYIFKGIPILDTLHLSSNMISSLPGGIFERLYTLKWLDLSSNRISTLPAGIFKHLSSIHHLQLSSNMISVLSDGVFKGLHSLRWLDLALNKIPFLLSDVFKDLSALIMINLSSNRLKVLPDGVFRRLVALKWLDLSSNKIMLLPAGVFEDLSALSRLDMSSNRIHSLLRGSLRGLTRCEYLNIANNGMVNIQEGSFESMVNLNILLINQNELEVTQHMFKGLDKLWYLIIDSYQLCCVKPRSVPYRNCLATPDSRNCTGSYMRNEPCTAPSDPISSCTAIIASVVLQHFLWIIGLAAVMGNAAVIVYRLLKDRKNIQKSYSIFVLNLGISDMLMGIYMLIIAIADINFRGSYAWHDQKWRRSAFCATAGILSTISSEMSIFVILLITIDRFIAIVFPLTRHKIICRHAMYMVITLWIAALGLSLIPQVGLYSYFKGAFYSKSGVCLALPLTGKKGPGIEYSVFLFVGLNSFIFLIIMLMHIGIYKSVKNSANSTRTQSRKRDIAVAKTLFLVVATDFCCWIPIGIMGIVSQVGGKIPDDVYAWVMIFVLPINSAINPFIYTFLYIWRKRRHETRAQNPTRLPQQRLKLSDTSF